MLYGRKDSKNLRSPKVRQWTFFKQTGYLNIPVFFVWINSMKNSKGHEYAKKLESNTQAGYQYVDTKRAIMDRSMDFQSIDGQRYSFKLDRERIAIADSVCME